MYYPSNLSNSELILKRTYSDFSEVPNNEYLFIHKNSSDSTSFSFKPKYLLDSFDFFGILYGVAIVGMNPIKLGYVWNCENENLVTISSIDENSHYCASKIGREKLVLEDTKIKKEIKIKPNLSLDELISAKTIYDFGNKPLLIQQFPMVLLGLNGIKEIL